MVAARSPAEIPVVDLTRSHDTVNAVFMASSFSLEETMRGRLSLSAVSSSTATHTSPLVWRIMKCMLSWVILSAAPMRSPSFSRSSSSSTTTNRPAATSARASSMEAKPGVGASGSSSAGLASGCQLGVCARTTTRERGAAEREIFARRARLPTVAARGRAGARSAAAGPLADLATARGVHLAAVNAAETVVIAAICDLFTRPLSSARARVN
mmetsp:Transcript_903/g.3593  ORF Transcript_903/g.3593 Transcript_903/m.3593 type:complete len:212 (+) Transcript_903:1089-1724(+)